MPLYVRRVRDANSLSGPPVPVALAARRFDGQHDTVMAPLESQSPAAIASHFATEGFALRVHADAPPAPTAEEMRRMPSELRRALRSEQRPAHWVDLTDATGEVIARWCGSGPTREAALRRAAQRWRIEQEATDSQRRPGQPLP